MIVPIRKYRADATSRNVTVMGTLMRQCVTHH
jgi:hypothetical protein